VVAPLQASPFASSSTSAAIMSSWARTPLGRDVRAKLTFARAAR